MGIVLLIFFGPLALAIAFNILRVVGWLFIAMLTPLPEERYQYRAVWDDHRRVWVGVCDEMRMCWVAPSRGDALHGIRRAVSQALSDMRRRGEPVPQPLVMR